MRPTVLSLAAATLFIGTAAARADVTAIAETNTFLHTHPNSHAPIVRSVPRRARLDVSNCADRWCLAERNGNSGYVSQNLLDFPRGSASVEDESSPTVVTRTYAEPQYVTPDDDDDDYGTPAYYAYGPYGGPYYGYDGYYGYVPGGYYYGGPGGRHWDRGQPHHWHPGGPGRPGGIATPVVRPPAPGPAVTNRAAFNRTPGVNSFRAPAANTFHAPGGNTFHAPGGNTFHAPAGHVGGPILHGR